MLRLVCITLIFLFFTSIMSASGREQFEKDVISTSGGDLEITFLGHGTLIFAYGNKIIHVDPYGQVADYNELPPGRCNRRHSTGRGYAGAPARYTRAHNR